MRPPDPPLSDGTFLLRPWDEDDVPALVDACNEPEIGRWLDQIPQPYTERDAHHYVRECSRGWGDSTLAAFAVVEPGSGELLGSVGIRFVDWGQGVAEIGYWTVADARLRGVATAALRLASRWALAEVGIARLQLQADVSNVASQRVAESAGFTREGVLRSSRLSRRGGLRRDVVLFSLLPGEIG